MDLIKLTTDAKAAREAAQAACDASEDGGTCNLDSTVLRLAKGQHAAPVIKALAAGGLSATTTQWLGRGLMMAPPGCGQAGKRHASNEALYKSLSAAGWNVSPYYQMD